MKVLRAPSADRVLHLAAWFCIARRAAVIVAVLAAFGLATFILLTPWARSLLSR